MIQPTLDNEIEALKIEIESNEYHTTRQEYVATVQPLKDQVRSLINQNEIIKAANKIITDTPTAEELEHKRLQNIETEISSHYHNEELTAIRDVLMELAPTNPKVIALKTVVDTAENKYPVIAATITK